MRDLKQFLKSLEKVLQYSNGKLTKAQKRRPKKTFEVIKKRKKKQGGLLEKVLEINTFQKITKKRGLDFWMMGTLLKISSSVKLMWAILGISPGMIF